MTEEEKQFLNNLQKKIDKYQIKKDGKLLTVRDCLSYCRGQFVKTKYTDGTEEVVDIGLEKFLYKLSPLLFIEKYGKFELPGIGELPCTNLYYFQKETLKCFNNYKKIVLNKTRQCLTRDCLVITNNGKKSIADVKIGESIQTLKNNKIVWTKILDFIPQGEKRTYETILENDKVLRSTGDHKVFTNSGWKEVQELTKNDLVQTVDGFKKVLCVLNDEVEEVFDITTETHDFLANGILVHNCGMSTLMSLIFWWKAVNFNSEWLVIISKDGKSAQDFLEKIKLNLNNIPPWFGLKINKNNVKGVSFSNKTKIDTFARSKSAGRGTSPTMVILDEAAFYLTNSIIEGIVSSVMPSLSRTGGQLMVVSTPNGSAEGSEGYWYYNQVRQLKEAGGIDGLSKLIEISWWEVLDYPGITPYKGYNEIVQKYIDRDYFNNPNVKKEADDFFMPIAKNNWKDNAWLKYQMDTSGKVKYLQEILQNFVVTGNTVFSDEIIERTSSKIKLPIIMDKLKNRSLKGLWIWKEPIPDHKYILSADIAKGSGDDSSSIQVVDMSTYEQVAEYVGKCTTLDCAHYAYEIGEYYNYAYSVIETNSIGEAVFTVLYYDLNYPNLFKQKKGKNGTEVMTGWITNMKTRELVTNKFIDFYYDDDMWEHYTPRSSRLLDQMRTWIWKAGRPDHSGTTHDDAIMSMAIGLYNIADGIKKLRNPDDVFFFGEDGSGISLEENKHKLSNDYIKRNLEENKTLDESKIRRLEEDMYRKAGINPEDSEAANNLKWLLS